MTEVRRRPGKPTEDRKLLGVVSKSDLLLEIQSLSG